VPTPGTSTEDNNVKRLFVIFTILLSCASVFSADFMLTLSDYRAQIKRRLNVDPTNITWMTDSVMNQLTREAIVTVNPRIEGIRVSKTLLTDYHKLAYAIDTSVIGVTSVTWVNGDTIRPLKYMIMESWVSLQHQSTNGADDEFLSRPSVYDYTDDSLYLFPVPTIPDDTIRYWGPQKITDIMTRDTIGALPQKYRIPILNYATYLVAVAAQHPAQGLFLSMADSSIAEMKR
jgi:hypothetical protein